MGDSKKLHPDTKICKSFEEAKVFVETDLSKELPKSYRFKSEKGIDAVMEYVYPWLPPRYVTCSKWGHLKDDCLANKGVEKVTILGKTKQSGNGKTTVSVSEEKGEEKGSQTEEN